MKENTCDKAIAILQATSDGDKLAPLDLKLVENAVNGFLNEDGIKVFNQLHETIAAGKYKQPWFHGIENRERRSMQQPSIISAPGSFKQMQ